jgi:hypothetical protein
MITIIIATIVINTLMRVTLSLSSGTEMMKTKAAADWYMAVLAGILLKLTTMNAMIVWPNQ